MKHCPQCDSSFPDTDQYCELDGTPLISDFSYRMAAPVRERESANAAAREVSPPAYRPAPESQAWKILVVSAIAVVATATALFVIYRQTQIPNELSFDESQNASATQPSLPLMSARPATFAGVSPSPEASPSPSATPSPSAQPEVARVVLSSSPVSTGAEEVLKSEVVIRLSNGTNVEADEVWETGEGIWYRHSGMVTLLERNQVSAIVRKAPASSPTATPVTSPGTLP